MLRFFFHAHTPSGFVEDQYGLELSGLGEAYAVAVDRVKYLIASSFADYAAINLLIELSVEDARGEVLVRVPFLEAIEGTNSLN